MKSILLHCFAILFLFSCKSDHAENIDKPPVNDLSLEWTLIDDALEGDDKRTSYFTLTNQSSIALAPGWTIYFSQFPSTIYLPLEAENKYNIESVNGDLYKLESLDSLPAIGPGEKLEFRYQWPVRIFKYSHAPLNPYIEWPDHTTADIQEFQYSPIPQTLTFMTATGEKSMQKTAEEIYQDYEQILDIPVEEISPILPTPKSISANGHSFSLQGGKIFCEDNLKNEGEFLLNRLKDLVSSNFELSDTKTDDVFIEISIDKNIKTNSLDGYILTIDSFKISIVGKSNSGVFYGIQSLLALVPAAYHSVPASRITLPGMVILDEPRFAYRGQHLDVARNFQSVESVKKLLDAMAMYKLNKFHFHLTDDEGWRLEIPDLPELTSVGGIRGADPTVTSLPPAYGSGADPSKSPGSGYYTREEFIDLLEYAKMRHIEVIPEINGPGHARAAIKAMEARFDRLMAEGKESDARAYVLHDQNDQSKYSSAQAYHDNVICVCQESTYTFLEKVIGEIVAMYREAGAPLNLIHTGGDEVPHGAWTGSPECQRMIEDEDQIHSTGDLHPYFVQRYLDIAAKHNVNIGGWEEITQLHTTDGKYSKSCLSG